MDFAEVARSYPQFGKSTWNLGRTREEVFSAKKVEFKRSNGAGCCGGAEADLPNWSSCGCDEGQRRSRAVVPHDIFDDPWGGGNDRPWAGGRKPLPDYVVPSNCMRESECCISIYCYPVDRIEHKLPTIFSHCYFLIQDCDGSSWRLHLDPNQAKMKPPQDHGFGEGNMVTLTANFQPDPNNDKFEWSTCEPCVMCGQSPCGVADCLVSEAIDYPLTKFQEQEYPLEGETELDIVAGPFTSPTYKLLGPNSNTFIAYLARKCGLPPLKLHGSSGRLPAMGAQLAGDRDMQIYLQRHADWLEERLERWRREGR